MDLKKLQYLESVYRLKNLTQAAMEHYVAQPSITKAIRSLEEELGVQLIRRTNTGISFTFQGEQLIPHVYRILADVKRAEEEMKDLLDEYSNFLVMCVSNIAVSWLLPLVFLEFAPRVPGCRLNTYEATSVDIISHLIKEVIFFSYTIFPDNLSPKLTKIPLIRSELHLVMPVEHRLAKYSRIPVNELDGENLLTYPKGALIRTILEEKCISCGAVPIIQCPSVQRSVTLRLVSLGVGLTDTLVSPISFDTLEPNLTTRGFEEPIYFDEGIIYNNEHYLNKSAKAFIKFMKEKCIQQPYHTIEK